MGHFGARLPSAAPAPPVGDASTGYGHSPPWPARWVRPWLHLGEHLLHGGDFGLLVCDDAAGEGLGVRVGSVGLLRLGHLDRALVVGYHHLEELPVEVLAGGRLQL